MSNNSVKSSLLLLLPIINQPEEFVIPQASLENQLSSVLKSIYDESCQVSEKSFGPFQELIVQDLDVDSIWEEIACRNRPLTRFLRKTIQELLDKTRSLQRRKEQHDESDERGADAKGKGKKSLSKKVKETMVDDDDDDDDLDEAAEEYDDDVEQEEEFGDDDKDDFDDIYNDEEGDGEVDNDDVDGVGDDNDFGKAVGPYGDDLDEDAMENFLDDMDELEEHRYLKKLAREKKQGSRGHKSSVEDEEESDVDDMDLVASEMYKDGSDDEDDVDDDSYSGSQNTRGIMAKDFFGSRRRGIQSKVTSALKPNKAGKPTQQSKIEDVGKEEDDEDDDDNDDDDFAGRDDFDDDEYVNGEDFGDEDGEVNEDDREEAPLSSYQQRKLKLLAEQEELERDLLSEKRWDMRGEVKSADRPENSLLEMNADIERASKPAPVITQEHTSTIEEMIIKRIVDSKFNDQTPYVDRTPNLLEDENENSVGLSQEKDKLGLGEIYANEFLAKTMGEDSAEHAKKGKGGEDEQKAEIKSLFLKVCRQLDALSHFHFTPKPTVAEGAVTVHNLPALMMEEVAPSDNLFAATVSQAAPEIISHKPRSRVELLPEAERTSEDRNRFRNASKRTRRTKRLREAAVGAAAASALESGTLNTGARGTSESEKLQALAHVHANKRLMETLKNDKRVTLSTDSDQSSSKRSKHSSSADFFAKLQDSLQAPSSAKGGKRKSEPDNSMSSRRVKL